MPPRRRDWKIPDPAEEREMLRRRDKQIPDPPREGEIHELCTRLDAMETTQKCIVDVGDITDFESVNEVRNEEVAVEDAAEECIFKVVARIGAREKMDIPVYEGNLDAEELLDWIRALYK
jgi:hypothetical protein